MPKDYPADVQRVHVYCDDGASVYVALSKAYRGICLCEMFEDEKLKNRIVDRAKTIEDLII